MSAVTKPSRRPAATSIEAAVVTGLAILDAEGLDALTIRRLAKELGVGTMTLYSYFETKDDLIDRIAAYVFGDIHTLIPESGPWDSRLTAAMKHLQATLRAHPGASTLSLTRRGPIPAIDPFRDKILGILRDGGFTLQDAIHALTALIFYVTGDIIIENARTKLETEKERARLAALPAQQYPNLSAAADHYASHVSQQAFDIGLESLIRGLALRIHASF